MKKQTYKVGDIFQIQLDENLTGFGRVLRKQGDSILVETYDIELYKKMN